MSALLRRRIMAGIVLFVLIWPLMHLFLVARFRLDPWEFFGWAMYSLPAARVQVAVDVERDGETSPLRAMGETRLGIKQLARRRTALGTLVSGEATARAIFEEDPTIDSVVFVFREIRLDRDSARLVGRDEPVRHIRPADR